VPPFFLYSGFQYRKPKDLNIVGLKRAGFSLAQVANLKKAYHALYRSGLKLGEALAKIERELADENTLHLVILSGAASAVFCRE